MLSGTPLRAAVTGRATARDPSVPGMALGTAACSLACGQPRAGASAEALQTLTQATGCNPDLRVHPRRHPDLRDSVPTGRDDPDG